MFCFICTVNNYLLKKIIIFVFSLWRICSTNLSILELSIGLIEIKEFSKLSIPFESLNYGENEKIAPRWILTNYLDLWDNITKKELWKKQVDLNDLFINFAHRIIYNDTFSKHLRNICKHVTQPLYSPLFANNFQSYF